MFSHDAQPPKIMELCKFYLFERCAKKEKCLYLHKGFPCKYYHTGMRCLDTSDSCKFSHEPLTEEIKLILIRHLESAPKEILGDFPRMSREQAVEVVAKTEAKHKGWDEPIYPDLPPAPGPGEGGGGGRGRGGGPPGFRPPGPRMGGGPRFGMQQGFGRGIGERGGGGFGNSGFGGPSFPPPPGPPPGYNPGPGLLGTPTNFPPPSTKDFPPSKKSGEDQEAAKNEDGGGGKGERRRKSRWHDDSDQAPSSVVAATNRKQQEQRPAAAPVSAPPSHLPVAVPPPMPQSAAGGRLLPAPAVANLEAFRGGIEQTKKEQERERSKSASPKRSPEQEDRMKSPKTANPDQQQSTADVLKFYGELNKDEAEEVEVEGAAARTSPAPNSNSKTASTPPGFPSGWYSSDEEGEGSTKQLKIVTAGGNDDEDHKKSDAEEVAVVENSKRKEEEGGSSSKSRRDPRKNRDPRSGGGGSRDPRKKASSSNSPGRHLDSEKEKERRLMEMDLGSVFGDLDLPSFGSEEEKPNPRQEEEVEERNSLGLPFKPFVSTAVAKEIDASIYSHTPLHYRLQVVKPKHCDLVVSQCTVCRVLANDFNFETIRTI